MDDKLIGRITADGQVIYLEPASWGSQRSAQCVVLPRNADISPVRAYYRWARTDGMTPYGARCLITGMLFLGGRWEAMATRRPWHSYPLPSHRSTRRDGRG